MSRNMTIPSRPAPPPPQAASNKITRYSPATNWDDTPFSPQNTIANINRHQAPAGGTQLNMKLNKKAPPPRPPPPKVVPALKKPGQQQSINILSNLFGQKRNHGGSKTPVNNQKGQIPMKLPPPPKLTPTSHHSSGYGSTASTPSSSTGATYGTDLQLINFESPPSSPTFTQKSCSDCISVDSFSSDSNYSSPNNGNMSQAESGFEDDFVSQSENHRSKSATPASSTMKDLWDISDPFGLPPSAAKSNIGSTSNHYSIYAPLGSATIRAPVVNSKLKTDEFVDPLCNGKTVAPKVQSVGMPTIIKPSGSASSSQKSTPVHSIRPKAASMPPPQQQTPWVTSKPPAPLPLPSSSIFPLAANSAVSSSFDDAEESLDSLPSLPMPNIPPPPPPPGCYDEIEQQEEYNEPCGIAMYDFNGETDEDLSFRANDKIYLLKRLNEEWLLGRDRRGCEGMFPANYIQVKVPLSGDEQPAGASCTSPIPTLGDISLSGSSKYKPVKVRVIYTFTAEAPEDLTIVENDYVTVLHQINLEWLYGELNGQRGQFPANFIEFVPPNLPGV